MATVTLRPDGTEYVDSPSGSLDDWDPAGTGPPASLHAATNDNSDSTRADQTVADGVGLGTGMGLQFGTTAVPALAQIRSLQGRVRAKSTTGDVNAFVVFGLSPTLSGPTSGSLVAFLTSSFATYTGPAAAFSPDGDAWTQADVDAILMHLVPGWQGWPATHTAFDVQVAEIYIDMVYNEAPVATVTTPAEASTITNDSTPSVAWTYTDPETDTQERVRVKVFSAAQYGAGGFDPETSTATWDSGELFTSATTVEIGVQLANATYRAYVKVADAGSSGRYGAWDYNQFTINLTPPPNPTIAATVQASQGRTKVDVTAAAGAPNTEFVMVEYSDDAGATWSTLRGAGKTALAPSASITFYDYEAPPGASRRNRAKAGKAV